MRRWKDQAYTYKAMAEALERRAMRAEADLAACLRSRDDPAAVRRAEAEQARLRTTLVAIVHTRDGDLDNVWQKMARAALDGTEHPQLQNEDSSHA